MDSVDLLRMTSPCCAGELEQIVDGADHRPLCCDRVEAAKEERAEASGMFDLAEHRFDDLLSQAVAATPAGALEFCRHGGLARAFRPKARPSGICLAVARPAGSQIAGDPTASEIGEVLLVTVAGVGRDFLGIGAQHRTDSFDQWHERAGICRARLQTLGDDDLIRTVDSDIGVVAGDHGTRPRRLDAAVGIGEITLRAIGRAAVASLFSVSSISRGGAAVRRQVQIARGFGASGEGSESARYATLELADFSGQRPAGNR
jgi:hypothetical protein